jgi:hypothetical protein
LGEQPKNLKHVIFILVLGLAIVTPLLILEALSREQISKENVNKTGIDIGYNVPASFIYINYTDLQNDTKEVNIFISVTDAYSGLQTPVFEKTHKTFPMSVDYAPLDKSLTYNIALKVNKTSGTYSYTNLISPIERERSWSLFGGYV